MSHTNHARLAGNLPQAEVIVAQEATKVKHNRLARERGATHKQVAKKGFYMKVSQQSTQNRQKTYQVSLSTTHSQYKSHATRKHYGHAIPMVHRQRRKEEGVRWERRPIFILKGTQRGTPRTSRMKSTTPTDERHEKRQS